MTEPENNSVLIEVRDGIGHLVLNRPKVINALDHTMVRLIADALERWRHDDEVRAVLLRGAGERGLCAGGDIVAIYRDAQSGGNASFDFWRDEYALNAAIARYPKPYIAIMDGIVMGGGVGLSVHGSIRIVTERSTIAMPETAIGLVPDIGGTYLLARMPGEAGTHVALTAGRIDGADAIACGLADHYVPSSSLEAFVAALGESRGHGAIEGVIAEFAQPAPSSPLLTQSGWIDAAYSADDVNEIVRRLRSEASPQAHEAADQLLAKSPIALTVTLRSLRRAARSCSLEETLNSEYRVSSASLRSHDLIEGIRAQVIDKDRNPKWLPASIDDVSAADIEAYFAPVGDRELGLSAP